MCHKVEVVDEILMCVFCTFRVSCDKIYIGNNIRDYNTLKKCLTD